MTKSNVKVNVIKGVNEMKPLYLLAGFMVLSFLVYAFLIGQTVFRLVEGKNLGEEKRILATEVSELELETLSLNDNISIEKAYEMGFVDITKPQFVTLR